ncbi:MAG: hypothetical protein HC840_09795 [Leptolyngbyaceae cyanobacterium RM2_2_4]|nr:hypothetical protein [Leptolyngbyaceae cyanobacterium RM2_2_4]
MSTQRQNISNSQQDARESNSTDKPAMRFGLATANAADSSSKQIPGNRLLRLSKDQLLGRGLSIGIKATI